MPYRCAMAMAAFVIAIVAVVIAVVALGLSLRYARGLKAAAGDVAKAAQDVAREAARSADASLERHRASQRRPPETAVTGRVAWELTCTRQHHYVLRNTGVDPAYRVAVAPHNVASVVHATWSFPEVRPGDEEHYTVVARVGSSITVTWQPDPETTGEPERHVLALTPS